MTTNRGRVFAVAFAVLLTVSTGALGVQGPVSSEKRADGAGVHAVQGSATGLNLTASGSNVTVPGHNVTVNFTLTNSGEERSTNPAIELVSVPGEWEIVDQSAGAAVNWSESNRAWISTEALAPGESVSVSVSFRLSDDAAPTEYYVSATASDAEGRSDAAVESFSVGRASGSVTVETSVADSTAQGRNVTLDVTFRNDGDAASEAPTVGLAVPAGWEVVNQSAGENVTYSEANAEWISTEPVASGESMTVSAVLRPANDTRPGEYFVSVRGYDASDRSAVTAATINVTEASDESATTATESAETTATESAETTADAGATTTAESDEARAQRISENVSATFLVDGEAVANVTLEVADSPEERAQGLMHRESLPENHGMVFVYDEADERSFWMKNTLIPLDMIFVDANGTVVDVEHADPPEPNTSDAELERYTSDAPAKYVIELEQGFANRTGVGPGAEVEFDVQGTLEPNETTTES